MTSLNKYIENQSQHIEESLQEIAKLQQQLNDFQQKLRIDQQVHQAQKTAEVEVSKSLNQLKKLFKDLCGIYPVEVLDDLADEIADMAEEVKDNYQEYAQSGRFLNGADDEEIEETQELTDAKDYTLIAESLPLEDDDQTLLTQSQIEVIIKSKDDKIHSFIRQQLEISGRVKQLSTLTKKMTEKRLTRKRLEDIIHAAELISKPLSLNGSSSINHT
ncbi:hypothetical protein [Crocosphaera chwakensis]|uniref:Uncharacterized protein n=1 Tax=Crocosphaera chwakensis CCY0110 TaxID=391612 RepID=A3IY41_9CHRO|nr:hypothetical protein [Crocosphaera chwakensis]EAZ88617.1 hypothetical protein CY0110_31470 [Crocosphaera chwakensis CCY0110]